MSHVSNNYLDSRAQLEIDPRTPSVKPDLQETAFRYQSSRSNVEQQTITKLLMPVGRLTSSNRDLKVLGDLRG